MRGKNLKTQKYRAKIIQMIHFPNYSSSVAFLFRKTWTLYCNHDLGLSFLIRKLPFMKVAFHELQWKFIKLFTSLPIKLQIIVSLHLIRQIFEKFNTLCLDFHQFTALSISLSCLVSSRNSQGHCIRFHQSIKLSSWYVLW